MATSGQINRVDFIGLKDDHSGIVQLNSTSMELTVTAATTSAHIGFSLVKNFGITMTPTKLNKGYSISFDQERMGSKFLKFSNNFIVTDDSTNMEYYCDSTAADSIAAASSEHNVVAIVYENIDEDDATKVLVWGIPGGFKEGAGTRTGKHQERKKPTMEFVSKKAKATISIPVAMFNTTILTAPGAAQDITSGNEFALWQLTKA